MKSRTSPSLEVIEVPVTNNNNDGNNDGRWCMHAIGGACMRLVVNVGWLPVFVGCWESVVGGWWAVELDVPKWCVGVPNGCVPTGVLPVAQGAPLPAPFEQLTTPHHTVKHTFRGRSSTPKKMRLKKNTPPKYHMVHSFIITAHRVGGQVLPRGRAGGLAAHEVAEDGFVLARR